MLTVTQLGVVGDRGGHTEPRIELRLIPTATGFMPKRLGSGTFAQVHDGQMRFGQVTIPLAIKVQRAASLNRERHQAVEAKFDAERGLHARLRAGRDASADYPIVEQIEWGAPGEPGPPKLPPSIVCPHARHALAPRCPKCGGELADDPWVADGGERALACRQCAERFGESDEVKARVVAATVRRDPGCEGCPKSEAECSKSAAFLNFFAARLLLFERLELDLDAYLTQVVTPPADRRPRRFWAGNPAAGDPGRQLQERLDLLGQALRAIAYLHQRGVAHLDVKPANFCLRTEGGRPRLCVIDLGLADDPQTQEYLRQAGGVMALASAFAPPEMTEAPKCYSGDYRPSKSGGHLELRQAPAGSSGNPAVVPGDAVEVRVASDSANRRGTVRQVAPGGKSLGVDWGATPPPDYAQAAEIVVRKCRGRAADLYSFGMLIFSVLTNDRDPTAYAESLGGWHGAIARTPGRGADPSEAWDCLREDTVFAQLSRQLDQYGDSRVYAEAAVGLALKLVCRSADRECKGHALHRGQEAEPVLDKLLKRWGELLAAFEQSLARRGSEAIAARWLALSPKMESIVHAAKQSGDGPAPPGRQLERAILLYEQGGDAGALTQLMATHQTGAGRMLEALRALVEPAKPPAAPPAAPPPANPIPLAAAVPNSLPYENVILGVLYAGLAPPLRAADRGWERFRAAPPPPNHPLELKGLTLAAHSRHAESVRAIAQFVAGLDRYVLEPLAARRDKSGHAPRAAPCELKLEHAFRGDLREAEAAAAAASLEAMAAASKDNFERFVKECNALVAKWNKLPAKLRGEMKVCIDRLQERVAKQNSLQRNWATTMQTQCKAAHRYVAAATTHVLRPWDAAMDQKVGLFGKLFGGGPRTHSVVKLEPDVGDLLRPARIDLDWLRSDGLDPSIEALAGILHEYDRGP